MIPFRADGVWPTHGVWFVYDGACPLCTRTAHVLRIQRAYGPLHLVDARTETNHPLLAEIGARQLDLDEGMVIWHAGQFHHGAEALIFMAQFGAEDGAINRLTRLMFRSQPLARLAYPGMRVIRNLLLRIKRVGRLTAPKI